MNLNLNGLNGLQSLGMIHVHGSMKTEVIQLVKSRLSKYKLGLNNHIVATITDGTSNIMMKLGKETSPIHNACLAHKIHFCVCDYFINLIR